MLTGTVKWFDTLKGFGFIVAANGEDVLVHFSAIQGEGFRSLFTGEFVEYDARRTTRGLQATRVRRLVVPHAPPEPAAAAGAALAPSPHAR
jgi:cold shock protein